MAGIKHWVDQFDREKKLGHPNIAVFYEATELDPSRVVQATPSHAVSVVIWERIRTNIEAVLQSVPSTRDKWDRIALFSVNKNYGRMLERPQTPKGISTIFISFQHSCHDQDWENVQAAILSYLSMSGYKLGLHMQRGRHEFSEDNCDPTDCTRYPRTFRNEVAEYPKIGEIISAGGWSKAALGCFVELRFDNGWKPFALTSFRGLLTNIKRDSYPRSSDDLLRRELTGLWKSSELDRETRDGGLLNWALVEVQPGQLRHNALPLGMPIFNWHESSPGLRVDILKGPAATPAHDQPLFLASGGKRIMVTRSLYKARVRQKYDKATTESVLIATDDGCDTYFQHHDAGAVVFDSKNQAVGMFEPGGKRYGFLTPIDEIFSDICESQSPSVKGIRVTSSTPQPRGPRSDIAKPLVRRRRRGGGRKYKQRTCRGIKTLPEIEEDTPLNCYEVKKCSGCAQPEARCFKEPMCMVAIFRTGVSQK